MIFFVKVNLILQYILVPLVYSVIANASIFNKMEHACLIPYSDKRLQELERLKSSVSPLYEVKFLDHRPPGLKEEGVINEVINGELKMTLSLGKNLESESLPLIIRRIDGACQDILSLAFNELGCLNELEGSEVIVKTLFY